MNTYIRAPEVRVVAPDGEQIGVKKLAEALWLAEQLDMDLVEVAPSAKPPVCKIMDYGKYKYEQSVREREAKWLSEGDKVKVTVRFRGRERERPEYGERVLRRLFETVEDMAQIEQAPSLEGRQMVMTIAPLKNRPKPEAVAEPSSTPAEEPAKD